MKFKNLITVLKSFKKLAIYTHNNPDPDCISSAYTLQIIAKQCGIQSKIIYGGHISRAENNEMVRQLKIKMFHINEINNNNFDGFAIVDSQYGSGNNSFPEDRFPDITFDHHKSDVAKQQFYDIDVTAGATATILMQYFFKFKIVPNEKLATAYCYALASETKDMDQGITSKDIKFYNRLYKYANIKKLSKIRHAKKPMSFIMSLKKAFNTFTLDGYILCCSLGKVDSPDYLSEIADILLEIEGVDYSIVTGRYLSENYVSTRTSLKTINLGQTLSGIVKPYGRAGGHDMIAAGIFSGDPQKIIKLFISAIKLKRKK